MKGHIMCVLTKKPLLVCVGDSITQGDTGLGYMAQRPWPEQVGERLGIRRQLRILRCQYCRLSDIWTVADRTSDAS